MNIKINSNWENYSPTIGKTQFCAAVEKKKNPAEKGFSLIEVTIAMLVFMVAIMGVFMTFAYAVSYNTGNSSRAQALALLQQRVEQLRSAKFTPNPLVTDSILLGGTKPDDIVTGQDGNSYKLKVVVDDDPFTANVQTDPTKSLKEISVTVTLERPTPGWQTSVPATIVLRRVRGN